MNNIVVVGSSRGIGAEVVKYFSQTGNNVHGVSRSFSPNCDWIEGDISSEEGIDRVVKRLGDTRVDAIIFCAGVWEEKGFMPDFDFRDTAHSETRDIMSINVIAPIELSKKLSKNLCLSCNPRAIYLGALPGLDQMASSQVAYSASKFALRGAIQGLRVVFKREGIGFTVINPGNVGTEEVLLDIREGRFTQQTPIPISDVVSTISFVLSVSGNTEIGDINLMQKTANNGN